MLVGIVWYFGGDFYCLNYKICSIGIYNLFAAARPRSHNQSYKLICALQQMEFKTEHSTKHMELFTGPDPCLLVLSNKQPTTLVGGSQLCKGQPYIKRVSFLTQICFGCARKGFLFFDTDRLRL